MDDTDKKIKEILNKEIDIPKHFDDAIKNALYTPKGRQAVSEYKRYLEHKKNRFRKVAVTTIASISTFSTICVAGFAYDRVWYDQPADRTVYAGGILCEPPEGGSWNYHCEPGERDFKRD